MVVGEHGLGFVERNAMLALVVTCLRRVPRELEGIHAKVRMLYVRGKYTPITAA